MSFDTLADSLNGYGSVILLAFLRLHNTHYDQILWENFVS